MTQRLNTIPIGVKALIKGFKDDFIGEKMVEMGCLVGDEVVLLKKAPLGDPLFVQIGVSQMGLRISEAKFIEVEKVE